MSLTCLVTFWKSRKNVFLSLLCLYRDDGLVIVKNISGPKSEKVKKDFQKLFKENELDIAIQCNVKVTNYLDVTLNLENSTYPLTKKKIIK